MKTNKAILLFVLSAVFACAQARFSGSVTLSSGVTVVLQSNLQPPVPNYGDFGMSGLKPLGDKQTTGFLRFSADITTHQYFGYAVTVDTADAALGVYKLRFGPLTATAEYLGLPVPDTWHALSPPAFPSEQMISTSDTISVDIFRNPATGQKVVDHLYLKRDCSQLTGIEQASCLEDYVQSRERVIEESIQRLRTTADPRETAVIDRSELLWKQYEQYVCSQTHMTPIARLKCELTLVKEHFQTIAQLYGADSQ
jgi:hypothetical protein